MEGSLPQDVRAVFGNMGSSNEARLALLERRLAIPPSPVESANPDSKNGVTIHDQDSINSVDNGRSTSMPLREQTPSDAIQEVDALANGLENGQPNKKRRTHQQSGAPPRAARMEAATTPTGARPSLSPYLMAGDGAKPQANTPGSKGKQKNTISRYFAQLPGDQGAGYAGRKPPGDHPPGASPEDAEGDEAAHALRLANQRLAADLQRTGLERQALEDSVQRLEREAAETKQLSAVREGEVRASLLRLATTAARQERDLTVRRLVQEAPRLGSLSVRRRGIDVQEVWEDGAGFKDIQVRLAALAEQRENIEAARKAAKRRLPLPGQPVPMERHAGGATTAQGAPTAALHPDDWVMQEEVYKVRLAALRREEDGLRADAARLEVEKHAYMRELKRLRDEEGSRFNNFPMLNNRYLLLNLLGRGGFSEVYRAFDLAKLREVACKIHQLNAQWSEAKKASYVKHSVREYHIHRGLHHPRIVSLLDIFEIDNNTFATVLEVCTGGDLDSYLKQHETLPEREARAVMAQVLSGLAYLNTKPLNVIHYDLKPANILFDANGECKITDFGLSKVVDEGHTQGMELTSQGAGTYWYLPPECFDVGATPLISNKVDVWSVGVILYQMLFGRRPFGHEHSQEQILRQGVMLNAREVQFPTKPSVSTECKDFIRACLAYRQEDRLDVHAAVVHPYFGPKCVLNRKERKVSGGAPRDTAL